MDRRMTTNLTGKSRILVISAILAFGGNIGFADDPKAADDPIKNETSDSGAAIADLGGNSGVVIDAGNEVGTVTSSNLKGQARLQEALGKQAYFRSLSAINLQKAIDSHLSNERERIESYYEMRDYRNEQVEADRNPITEEIAIRRAKEKAPDRLTSQQYDEKSGKIFWPKPLDDQVLKPYTRVIEQNFAKRSDPGHRYGGGEARMVERLVKLIQRAVDSIKEELTPREYIALSDYLASIHYEAMFDLAGNRVIND